MADKDLATRLGDAADEQRRIGDLYLAELLEEALEELDRALTIADKIDSDEARAFVDRHSSAIHPAQEAWLRDMRELKEKQYFRVSNALLRDVFTTNEDAKAWFAVHGCELVAYGASAEGLAAVLKLHN